MENKQTIFFKNKPTIISSYSIAGPKESYSVFAPYFDLVLKDDLWDCDSYELAERKMLEHVIFNAIERAKLQPKEIDALICGDLLNQIISSSFAARRFDVTYIGLFGACSTMAESLAVGACLVDAGYFDNVACATASHFSSVERQFRMPLELGNQRPPTAQWTVTGGGCSVLSNKGIGPHITMATFGKVVDFNITDANNMGAAMAPAAHDTLAAMFHDTGTSPADYDLIVTGDLGSVGYDIVLDFFKRDGISFNGNYKDCGMAIYDAEKQDVHAGGSGCGCSAVVLCGKLLNDMKAGKLKKIIFAGTGALLSPVSTMQGESIPCVCHAVCISADR